MTAALLLLLAAAPALAASASEGTTAASFLRLSPGARAAAMGGAFGGAADDALASHYNPAGLGFVQGVDAGAGRESRFEGLSYDWAALAVPVLAWTDSPRKPAALGTAALSVFSHAASGIERRGLVETDDPTGSFGYAERAYVLAYGIALPGGAALGAAGKLVDSQLDDRRASAFSGDAGVMWRRERWSAGAGVRNAFGRLSLGSGSDPLPAVAYAGAGVRPAEGWLLCAEYDRPREGAAHLGFGLERRQKVLESLAASARLGYRTDRAELGRAAGISLGVGLGWRRVEAEMSWSPGGMLGDVLQYSLRARF